MRIAVVGTGYVGLVSAACFAELGHDVVGVDIDEAKVEKLKKGISTIYEPGLEELIRKNLKAGRLSFVTDLREPLPHVQILFSAVATPPGQDHRADLKAIFAVAQTVAKNVTHDLVFVNKSTVPVGTGKECEMLIAKILKQRKVRCSVPVVSNPEFLREGLAVTDTLMPDRIIVGINGAMSYERSAMSKEKNDVQSSKLKAQSLMEELYKPITRVGKPIVFMSRESAEIVKYASNAFLATKISFINMIAEFAEKSHGNIRDIARGMGLDNRIGSRFLHAGIGYGGSCFPKDVQALMVTAKDFGIKMPIIEATNWVNKHQRLRFIDKILENAPRRARIGILGLSFKPKTDDMREAPSLEIIPALRRAGFTITAYDPVATENAKKILKNTIAYASKPLNVAKQSDAVVLLTEWDEFRGLDLHQMKKLMKGNLLFDGRNVYEPEEVQAAGLKYFGMGL